MLFVAALFVALAGSSVYGKFTFFFTTFFLSAAILLWPKYQFNWQISILLVKVSLTSTASSVVAILFVLEEYQ